MKQFLFIFLICCLWSCKNFETKKLSSEAIVEEEMQHIDWKNLDSYPSFQYCEKEYQTTEDKKQCFKEEISKHIFEVLAQHEVALKDSIREVLELKIRISSQGDPTLEKVKISRKLIEQIPELENWLHDAIESLPEIYPAEKRGVNVSAEFKLPMVIQSE